MASENSEEISAFAFKTGRLIEELINKETENLRSENKMLQARILHLWAEIDQRSRKMDLKGAYFKEIADKMKQVFDIKTVTHGRLGEA